VRNLFGLHFRLLWHSGHFFAKSGSFDFGRTDQQEMQLPSEVTFGRILWRIYRGTRWASTQS
jgi:hypothetical protein